MALARRARETSDVSFYDKADAALAKSFEISPGNLEGQKVQAWILLGKHEFAKAGELAKQLNEKWLSVRLSCGRECRDGQLPSRGRSRAMDARHPARQRSRPQPRSIST
jgi:hypothetical protein